MASNDTRTEILDHAQELVETRGYNGFSYRDIAERLGIRTAAVHYHFPSKARLGTELIVYYNRKLTASLRRIDEQVLAPRKKLERYIQLFMTKLKGGERICLCAVLAIEYPTLPPEMQRRLKCFIEENEAWLAQVLGQGRKARALEFDGSTPTAARAMYSTLQGAIALSRVSQDPGRLTSAGRWLLDALVPQLMEVLLPPE
jgi:TetR/AcrR family transcriptional repressor of nem operon